MSKIKNWYNGLSNAWKAALRTAGQSFLAALGLFLVAGLNETVDLLNGGSLEESVNDMSNAGRVFALAVISVATGLVSLFFNRGDKGASYDQ